MKIIRKISLVIMVVLYLLAGINHFIFPQMYQAIIPPYIGHAFALNIIAGIVEIIAAVLIALPRTRRFGCYLLISILIAFIPAHIYMIQVNCQFSFCQPQWLLWLRLLVVQPLLILWAWWHSLKIYRSDPT